MLPARILQLVTAGLALAALPLTVTAQSPGALNYTPPTESIRLVNHDKLTLDEAERDQISTLLVIAAKNIAASHQSGASQEPQLLAKCMALALDLTPGAKAVTVANFQFAKNVAPPLPPDAPGLRPIAAELARRAESLSATGQADNQLLANYLFELAATLDPLNENAVFQMSVASRNGFKPAWAAKLAGGTVSGNSEPFLGRTRSAIKILLVSTTKDGAEIGSTNNLIGLLLQGHEVVQPAYYPVERRYSTSKVSGTTEPPPQPVDTGNLRVSFVLAGSVGSEMNTAAQEAARLVSVRHRELPALRAQLSFEDKYTPKDGGSCGTAVALVLLSLVENFDLDPNGVITGDITVDGQVQKIGGVSAKTEGALAADAEFMVLPAQNAADLDDYFVLHSLDDARKIQIFAADSLDAALTLMKKEKSGDLAQAMTLFRELPSNVAKLKTSEARQQLQEIIRLAPNHLSANILLRGIAGALPAKMSVTGSIEQIFSAAAPMLSWLANNSERSNNLPIYPQAVGEHCIRQLNALNFKVNPKTASLQDAMLGYVQELQVLTNSGQGRDLSGNVTYNPRFRPVLEARAKLYAEIRALQCDKSVLAKYIRKGAGDR